jgi:hypothetical protein
VKRVIFAFGVGLGMGLAVAAFRVIQKAQAGFSGTVPGSGAGGTRVPSAPAGLADLAMGLGQRVRSALDEGMAAARETEEELRGKVLNGGR